MTRPKKPIDCPNLLSDGKCLFREAEIQGSDLLKNLPCLVSHGFSCLFYEQKVVGSQVRYKDPAKMSDAELTAHIQKTCKNFPCDGGGCAVVQEHKDMCRWYSVPKIPVGMIKQRDCECGNPLQPRARYCDDCKKKRRKLAFRKANSKRRVG